MSVVRKQPSMPHTEWIDQCCSLLVEKNEYPTDASLVSLIKARSLAGRISKTFSYDDPNLAEYRNEALLEMSINSFRQEFAQIEAKSSSPVMQENCQSHLHFPRQATALVELSLT
jgi:hypothetical protein